MAKRQRSRESSLKRRVDTREPKRTFLIVCEGERIEPAYLDALRRQPQVQQSAEVEVRIDVSFAGSAPLTLVQAAVDAHSDGDEIDEVWCVFDVEAPVPHPKLSQARNLAEAHGVRLAVSNPCFEIWLVLHFRPHTRWLSTADANRLRRELDGSTGKEVDGSRYMDSRWDAVANARRLAAKHVEEDSPFPKDNPSSSVYELVEAIEDGSNR